MARSKHTHKFIQVGRKGYDSKIWKCALPDCTWFVHLGLSHVMLGKSSICWGCEESFVIDEDALREDMPKCADCRTPVIAGPPVQDTRISSAIQRTPEQQRVYEKEMKLMFGPDWKRLLGE